MITQMSPLFQVMPLPVSTLAANEMAARAIMNTPRLSPMSTAKAVKRDAKPAYLPCRLSRMMTGKDITWNRGNIWVVIAYAVWAFIYFAYSWAASGRTAGMALFGVRVVTDDGTDASGRRAVVRTLAFPLSFLFLGLGFAGILLGDQRRALHDVIAGTAVIYSWDARAARLRFLSRS